MSVKPLSGIVESLFSNITLNLLKNPCCDSIGEIVNLDFAFLIICLILLLLLGSDLKFCIISLCKPLASIKWVSELNESRTLTAVHSNPPGKCWGLAHVSFLFFWNMVEEMLRVWLPNGVWAFIYVSFGRAHSGWLLCLRGCRLDPFTFECCHCKNWKEFSGIFLEKLEDMGFKFLQ